MVSPSDACDLNLDPNTVNNNLILSEGNKKATHGAQQSYPDQPERFVNAYQVLCKESLSGQHYWEVEWRLNSDNHCCVNIAVAYREIERKSNNLESQFGRNALSWAFENNKSNSHTLFALKNNEDVWRKPYPSDGCNRVGVYLDWPAGTLSFYRVSSNTLRHLYTFHTTFTEPVYPGFGVYNTSNYVHLHPVK